MGQGLSRWVRLEALGFRDWVFKRPGSKGSGSGNFTLGDPLARLRLHSAEQGGSLRFQPVLRQAQEIWRDTETGGCEMPT